MSGVPFLDRRRRLAQDITNSLSVANAYFGPEYNQNPDNDYVPDPADFTATVIDQITVTPSGEPDGSGQYVGSWEFGGRGTAQLQYPSPNEATFLFGIFGNFTQTHTGVGTSVSITFTAYAARVRGWSLIVFDHMITVGFVESITRAPFCDRSLPPSCRWCSPCELDLKVWSGSLLTQTKMSHSMPVTDERFSRVVAEAAELAADPTVHLHRLRAGRRRGLLHRPGDGQKAAAKPPGRCPQLSCRRGAARDDRDGAGRRPGDRHREWAVGGDQRDAADQGRQRDDHGACGWP